MCNNICRNCKHWGEREGFFSAKKLISSSSHWRHHPEDAVKFCVDYRAEVNANLDCAAMHTVIEIDQGSGLDAGGASVKEICTPGEFGCNKFVQYDPQA